MNEEDFDEGLCHILVCTAGEDCARVTKERYGSPTAIYDAIKAARNEKDAKRQLYVVRTSCQGWCQYAPVCAILPGHKVLQNILPQEAPALVDAVLKREEKPFKSKRIWDFSKTRDENYGAKD